MAGKRTTKDLDMVAHGNSAVATTAVAHITKHLDDIPLHKKIAVAKKAGRISEKALDLLETKLDRLKNPATESECDARDKVRIVDISAVIIAMKQLEITFSQQGTISLHITGKEAEKMMSSLSEMKKIIQSGNSEEAEAAARAVLALTGQEAPEEAIEIEASDVE